MIDGSEESGVIPWCSVSHDHQRDRHKPVSKS
jgi:hypothetical protein